MASILFGDLMRVSGSLCISERWSLCTSHGMTASGQLRCSLPLIKCSASSENTAGNSLEPSACCSSFTASPCKVGLYYSWRDAAICYKCQTTAAGSGFLLSPKWPVLLLPARSSLHLADPYSSLTPVGCLEVVPLGVIPHSGDLCSCPLCSITSQPGAQGVLTMRSVSSIQEPRSALRLQACRKMMCDSPP
ncbi:PREDICTED: uncharacterized protein LOC105580708 isoform X3 [Cercocebus atys]|uniref:uncharacterized protein LOC105580708 isoform X3 n=1 Tax=Cercocebus atys TaxID=9531 RepID=UPI0005F4C642|nr:PREDICTED: uncharacterized protein LOC105580708 isoform X3 [Cercocebus atys]